jgi:hypothetical protein
MCASSIGARDIAAYTRKYLAKLLTSGSIFIFYFFQKDQECKMWTRLAFLSVALISTTIGISFLYHIMIRNDMNSYILVHVLCELDVN